MTGDIKAKIVELVTERLSDGKVVKIVRPCGDPPSFEIYTKEDGLFLVFAFDSDVGKVLTALVGGEGTSYHRTFQDASGINFEKTPVEGLEW